MLNDTLAIYYHFFNELPVGAGFDDDADCCTLCIAHKLSLDVVRFFPDAGATRLLR